MFSGLALVFKALWFFAGLFPGIILLQNPAIASAQSPTVTAHAILIGRLFMACVGMGSLFIFYHFVRRFFDERLAAVATFFFALNPLHIALSQAVNVYAVALFFGLLAMFFIFRIFTDTPARVSSCWLSGICIGLAAGASYVAVVLFAPLAAVYLLQMKEAVDARDRARLVFRLGVGICAAIAAYLVITRFVLLQGDGFFAFFKQKLGLAMHPPAYSFIANKRGWWSYPVSLRYALGTGVYILAAGGLALGCLRPVRKNIPILSLLLFFYLFMGFFKLSFVRLLLFVVPFVIIMSAQSLVFIVDFIADARASLRSMKNGILAGLSLCVILPSVLSAVYYGNWVSQRPTEKDAAEWCYRAIPARSSLLVDAIGKNVDFVFKRSTPFAVKTIDWEQGGDPVTFFKANRFDYIIIDASRMRPPGMEEFYAYIERHFTLLREFRPAIPAPGYSFDSLYSSSNTTCNPIIWIYGNTAGAGDE